MTHRRDVKFIDINDNFERVQQIVSEAGHSRYPVIDSDPGKILGVLRTKQLIANVKSNIDFNVRDFLTPVVSFHEATQCMDALDTFRNQRIHIAAVVDDYGVFEGIFTTSDLLEAIVGFIPSNYDSDEDPHIVQRQDSSWLLDGLTTIDEIHMIIDPDLIPMHKNYQTIAGFLLNQFMVPPKVGAILDYAGYRFEIVDMDKYRIDKILLIKLPS
jgi:putative hemolysin